MAEDKDKKTPPAEETSEALKARIAELEKAVKDKEVSEEALLKSNQELQEALEQQEKSNPKVFVTFEKQKYEVVIPKFQFNQKAYEAKDLKENKELMAELVKKKSGVLKPVK